MHHNAHPFVEKMTSEYRDVENSREPIALDNNFKFEDLVGSGSEAKMVVATKPVLFNGQVATQQCEKLMGGNAIEFAGQIIRIHLPTQVPQKHYHVVTGTPT